MSLIVIDVYQSHIVALTGDIKYKKIIVEKDQKAILQKSLKMVKNAK
jgi:hypothetical protein